MSLLSVLATKSEVLDDDATLSVYTSETTELAAASAMVVEPNKQL
jgi:hypothetical protein